MKDVEKCKILTSAYKFNLKIVDDGRILRNTNVNIIRKIVTTYHSSNRRVRWETRDEVRVEAIKRPFRN